MPRLQEPELLRDAPRVAAKDPAERRRFVERLKTYGIGVLIGCMLAAMLFIMRWQMNAGQPPHSVPAPTPASGAAPAPTPK